MDLPLLASILNWFGLLREEKGQSMVEYGLIIALIAIVVIGVLFAIGGNLNNLFGKVNNCLTNAAGGTGGC